jgi:hypothetical protein
MDTSNSTINNLFAIGIIITFITIFVWTFLTIFSVTVTTSGDKALDLTNAMTTVVMVDFVLVVVYAGIATYYVTMNPSLQQPYMMLLLHINILLSITALSFSSFYSI